MFSDYESYEKECDRIEKENESLLDLFEKDLRAAGLKERTIRNHLYNADFYINAFLMRIGPCSAAEGTDYVDSFLGDFFIRKCMWSTPQSVKTTAASIKKFYKSMMEHGITDKESYSFLCLTIKENLDWWQENCRIYNEPDESDSFFFF